MVSGEIDSAAAELPRDSDSGREPADVPAAERSRDPARARRRWLLAQCSVALAYTIAALGLSATSADLGFFTYRGSPILSVDPDGAARAAGVEAGDRVTSVDGRRLTSASQVDGALGSIEPGRTVALGVSGAGGVERVVMIDAGRRLPWISIAAAVFAAFILVLALLSDRGGPRAAPRQFFRQSLAISFLLVGAFSWDVTMSHALLSVPWVIALVLTPPMTCHFMMCHPAGREDWSRSRLAVLYGPALLLGALLVGVEGTLAAGAALRDHQRLILLLGGGAALSSAGYLTFGAISRMRRVRRYRHQLSRSTVLWFGLSSASASVPILICFGWAVLDLQAVVAGGFRPLLGIAVVGGCTGAAMTLADVPLGEIDRLLRRRTGHILVTGLAAGVFLLVVAGAGGLVSALSDGNFAAALAATLIAAFLFGPVRERAQRCADSRFGRDRERARRLLREAAEAALATLDVRELGARVVTRVRDALSAEGTALYARDADGGWRRVAIDGAVPTGDPLPAGDTIAERLDGAGAELRTLCADIVAVPVAAEAETEGGRRRAHPHALVVSPRAYGGLSDEDRELLSTLAAQLAVALGNARAHEDLARMRDQAEKRRREIARLKDMVDEENRRLLRQLESQADHEMVVGPGMRETFDLVRRVARTDSTVLLRGETGCGKEVVARALHAASGRSGGPFVVVDCGALPGGLVESALFGHERGAFTGAVADAPGAFREADGGTIFLDELGELPMNLQPVLLRVLQEREVRPVGASKGVRVDVRVVAGTHRDLAALVAEGRFREDLWYRLRVLEIDVPPLRERRDDILPLAEHFLTRAASRSGRPRKRLTAGARVALLEHEWPGNVRELEHAIEAATVYAPGEEVLAAHLPIQEAILRCRGRQRLKRPRVQAQEGLREALDGLERERVLEVLREQGGNRSRAARALGISRGALLRRLTRYGVGEQA